MCKPPTSMFSKIGLRWECDSDMCWLRSLKRWGTTLKHAGIPLGMSAIYIHSTPIPRPLTFLSWALTQIFNQIDICNHCSCMTVIEITLWNYFTLIFLFQMFFPISFKALFLVPKWKQKSCSSLLADHFLFILVLKIGGTVEKVKVK